MGVDVKVSLRKVEAAGEDALEDHLSIDVDVLLKPLSDTEKSVGIDFRDLVDPKSLFFTLKDLRASARSAERETASANAPESEPLRVALREWEEICEIADRALREQSKDLEVACWYSEALVRTASFAGLAKGLELLARLVETYWDEGLYPVEDEDGLETRIAPLAGLIGRGVAGSLVQPIRLLPLTDRRDGPVAALWTVELAFAPARSDSADVRDRQAEQADALIRAVTQASPDFLRGVRSSVARSLENLDRLMTAVDVRTGVGGFGTQVAEPLRAIAKLLDDRVGYLFVEDQNDSQAPREGSGFEVATSDAGGRLTRREDALARLLEVAEFFERTEPQSLVSSSVRETVRRARLPIRDLILELLPDETQREDFFRRSGIREVTTSNEII